MSKHARIVAGFRPPDAKAVRDLIRRSTIRVSGAYGLLWLVTVLVGTAFALLWWLLPAPLVLPTFSLLLLAAAGSTALLAWLGRAERRSERVTFWDVAGALAFIGFAAGMLCDPVQLGELGQAMTAE
jgi:4-hydroxybenzoate polyprenyltransferase